MRNLALPSRDAVLADLKKGVRKYKHKNQQLGHLLTEQEAAQVLAIYDQYDLGLAIATDALKGEHLAGTLREEIRKAFDKTQGNRQLKSIRELCFREVGLCPICGIDKASELDHHLPRSIFKPLAIYPRNLIPLCHDCNHTKNAAVGAEGLGFVHAYFDMLPDEDFIQATVAIEANALLVVFGVNPDAAIEDALRNRLLAQVATLNLNDRYREEVANCLSSHVITLRLIMRAAGADGVRAFLQKQTAVEVGRFHRNHWRPVLLRALALHEDFVGGGFADVLPMAEGEFDELAARLGFE